LLGKPQRLLFFVWHEVLFMMVAHSCHRVVFIGGAVPPDAHSLEVSVQQGEKNITICQTQLAQAQTCLL
jgi:hypothetical protein